MRPDYERADTSSAIWILFLKGGRRADTETRGINLSPRIHQIPLYPERVFLLIGHTQGGEDVNGATCASAIIIHARQGLL
jgi:hypothetical protein